MAKQSFTTGQVLTAAQMTSLQANDYNQTVNAKVASYVLVATDAGTRITMSNASATTITVNTALFTAGDTLTITNIGAGVCTITAGTATVSTGGSLALNQYDSGTLYFTSTGVSIWNGANPGDITGVTAGVGITGGGTSGTVTVTNDMATTITTNGDLIYGTGSGTYTRRAIGSTGNVLTVSGGIPVWSAPAGGGKVLQVVSATTATQVTNSTSTYADTLLTATITPTLNTSKVLVMVSQNGVAKFSSDTFNRIKLFRGATEIAYVAHAAGETSSAAMNNIGTVSINYYDAPATTSATTYKTQFISAQNTSGVKVQDGGSLSTIILLEIGA